MNYNFTIVCFGAGQESITLLHKIIHDPQFRERHIKGDLIVIGSDTGDEHDHTYKAVQLAKQWCADNDIEMYWLTPDMGFHSPTWQSLTGQYRKNSSVGSAAFLQTCTDNLKVKVMDRFIEHLLCKRYYEPTYGVRWKSRAPQRKAIYNQYSPKIRLILGFAKGEEKRTSNGNKFDPKWKKEFMFRYYPLIEDGLARQDCIDYNTAHIAMPIFPSNCKRCFYQSDQEILWLYRNNPADFWEWVELEKNKLSKYAHLEKNLGVYGKITLEQKLQKAQDLYGHWSDEQLNEYKFSHGHCIKSKY